jgi:undecaprenol kinase
MYPLRRQLRKLDPNEKSNLQSASWEQERRGTVTMGDNRLKGTKRWDAEHWKRKFRQAAWGVLWGMEGQSSFLVHGVMATAVLVLAAWLQCSLSEWLLLILCIGGVVAAELFNSALEWMAQGLCREENAELGKGLDIASGAVLVASIASAIIGLVILGGRILSLLGFGGTE